MNIDRRIWIAQFLKYFYIGFSVLYFANNWLTLIITEENHINYNTYVNFLEYIVLLLITSSVSFMLQLDDAALQLYKDGDYSSYLDLDSSIAEQHEEFDNFQFKYVQLIAYDIQPKQP